MTHTLGVVLLAVVGYPLPMTNFNENPVAIHLAVTEGTVKVLDLSDADYLAYMDYMDEFDADGHYEDEWDEDVYGPIEDDLTDAEADAMTLISAGWGTDEDYGYYGDDY